MEEEVKSVEVDWNMVEDSQVNETAMNRTTSVKRNEAQMQVQPNLDLLPVEVMSTAFSLPASGKPAAAVAPIRRSKSVSIAMVEDNG